ncbi:MAG: DUF3365 domain-containing protein [Gammaproteobacteria bacterium]|nr:DUF3365 domain-containing protein [Gammaproteobacteria bacterium]
MPTFRPTWGLPALVLALAAAKADPAFTAEHDAAALYQARCGSCHLAATAPRVAPPAHAVQRRYRRAYPQREAFVEAVAAWIAAPDAGRALMHHAVERFGLMPAQALGAAERRLVADYLYEAELPPPGPGGGTACGQADNHAGPGGAGGPLCGGADGGRGQGRGDGGGHDCAGQGDGSAAPDGQGAGRHAHGGGPGCGHGRHGGAGLDGAAAEGPEAAARAAGAAALAPFKQRLMATLGAALAAGAPAAVERCRLEAPAIPAAVAAPGIRVGRASNRLRNPDNVAPPWAAPLLAAYLDGSAEPQPLVVAIDDAHWGYVEPILVKPMCLACHGVALGKAVAEAVRTRYPADRATGYAVGDLRGVFWAELPR